MDSEKVSWHPGFVSGLKEEFDGYEDVLTFLDEQYLAKDPLRIDVLVIKKPPGAVVDKNIGRIFKGHNIFEYKSPTDYIAVRDFMKVCGYAWLYASQNDADIKDITLSFVSSHRPQALLEFFKHVEYTVEKQDDGVYYVHGCFVPVQLLIGSELSEKENRWLKSYQNNITADALAALLEEVVKRGNAKEIPAYLNALLTANAETLKEVQNMYVSQKLLNVIMEIGLVDDKVSEAKEEGVDLILNLLQQGYTPEQLQAMRTAGTLLNAKR
jgi:hypothetical protein